jgi:hypothetical protein
VFVVVLTVMTVPRRTVRLRRVEHASPQVERRAVKRVLSLNRTALTVPFITHRPSILAASFTLPGSLGRRTIWP